MFDIELMVNPENLEEESLKQLDLFKKVRLHELETRISLFRRKNELKEVETGLDYDIRRNPASFGLQKITESAVESTIRRDPGYREARDALESAEEEHWTATAYLELCRERGEILRGLIHLFTAT